MDSFRSDIPNIPQVLSISAAKILENLQFNPKLKWPNDVLLSGKKTAGILCETTSVDDSWCIVLGIGMNINMPLEILMQIDRPATSLLAEDGNVRIVEDVVGQLLNQFNKDLALFLQQGFLPFIPYYRHYLVHNQEDDITFHDNQQLIYGKFKGINEDGSLNLLLEGGKIHKFYAGEIL
jgi:BirA family transcriptional regulator, biotin operon repressor / biotin---[acetyl-CoA-carboxylase] ligase